MPNAAITPAVSSQQNGTLTIAAELVTEQYNAELDNALKSLGSDLPGAEFIRLDVFAILNDIVEIPYAFRFKFADFKTPSQLPSPRTTIFLLP